MCDLASRLSRPALLAVVASAFLGAGVYAPAVGAAAVPGTPTAPPPRTPTQHAIALVNEASNHVAHMVPACSMQRQDPKPRVTISDGAPDPALLRVLGVLRRAPTREELRSGPRLPGPEGVVTFFRRFTRIVHGPNGFVTRIAAGFGQESVPVLFRAPCQQRINATLTRLLRGQPHAVRHIALKIRRSFKLGDRTRRPYPWLDYGSAGGGTGGAFDVRRFRTHGLMIEGGGIDPPPPGFDPNAPGAWERLKHHYEVTGLVPDGVARVRIEIVGGVRGPSPGEPAGAAVRPFGASVAVRENAFGFHLPEDPIGAKMRLVWRDAAGRVLRVVR
jgi:hypothetical protein